MISEIPLDILNILLMLLYLLLSTFYPPKNIILYLYGYPKLLASKTDRIKNISPESVSNC